MATVKSLNKWANRHTYYPLDVVRMALGVFLFIKGLFFIQNTQILINLIEPIQSWGGSMMAVHYVAPAHLIGGLLIIFGLLTRWASIAQIPILIGAIAINFVGELNGLNLILAITALALCIFFTVYGSGKNSADYYFKMQQ